MGKELKITDFDQMLTASTQIGNASGVDTENITVQLEDSDGELYYIEDVVFDPKTRAIHIQFNYED